MPTQKGATPPSQLNEHRYAGGQKDRPNARGRSDSGDAFVPDPQGGPITMPDDLAEELAEEFVSGATLGQYQAEEARDAETDDETGGPFVIVPASEEMADDVDDMNPADADQEPLPSPMRSIRQQS